MDRLTDQVYCGVDVGASATKLVLLDAAGVMVGFSVRKSGVSFEEAAEKCLHDALRETGLKKRNLRSTFSTGYGRRNVPFSDGHKTEISCHSRGCYALFPHALTILDIGGQDSKIIKLEEDGSRRDFKMNRKCAAGTGAFLEELAAQMDLPLERLNELASVADEPTSIGSFCTVFAKTEILAKIRSGRRIEEIVLGVFESVVKRVLEMDPLGSGPVVVTGGVVAYNPIVVKLFERHLGTTVLVPEHPQLTGALGAALYALAGERTGDKTGFA